MQKLFKQNWWKILGVVLLVYVIIGGLLVPLFDGTNADSLHFPNQAILYETVRNLFFHVTMWFAMVFLLLYAFVNSIIYLSTGNINYDIYARNAVKIALLFGAFGIFTGMIWVKATWAAHLPFTDLEAYWVKEDAKLNGAAIGMLIYFAYMILRGSVEDENKRARLAAVYNIFAFVIYILFIFVIPRLTSSLHPGNGGNPGFSAYDLDSTLRLFFYPAVFGWTLIAFWIASLGVRLDFIQKKIEDGTDKT
ncbi:MAG: cytochrome c biogenesis protein CcsA [Chitinophagales bacterium]